MMLRPIHVVRSCKLSPLAKEVSGQSVCRCDAWSRWRLIRRWWSGISLSPTRGSGLYPLLYDFHPLLPDRQEARLIEREGKPAMMEACYWSRILGQPILVRFGRRQDVEEEAREFDEHPQEWRAKLKMRTSDHFGGIVYHALDLPWERFAPGNRAIQFLA
jgi:hypothetical protein